MKKVLLISVFIFLGGCSWASQMSYEGRAHLGLTKESLVLNDKSSLDGAGIVIGRVIRENVTGGLRTILIGE